MALTPRLDLRQTQTLVMTPQLQQAIRLLQFSNVELSAFVEEQLEQNPLLERDEGSAEGVEAAPNGADEASAAGGDRAAAMQTVDRAINDESGLAGETALDVDYDNQFDTDAPASERSSLAQNAVGGENQWGNKGGSFDDTVSSLEGTLSRAPSLREHLLEQLNLDIADAVDRMIGLRLIDSLDETGYLTGDLSLIAAALGCEVERVEKVLAAVQRFDPAGVFARNLAECLSLQLEDRRRLDGPMRTLLDNLDLVAKRDISALAKKLRLRTERITAMIAELRSLDPKPGLAFDEVVAATLTPDVIMRPDADGGWLVEINNEALPKVLVNNSYYTRISASNIKDKDKQYVNECYKSASWLVKSMHQRATTILRVATEIVIQQNGFFTHGIHALRPLVLRDIARVLDLHESTISRVTSNKYISTPRGIFELKYFFSQAIGSSTGGDAHSAEWVRHRIKELIDAEPPNEVLSDDSIVEILGREGIDIARRTVAKYREAMGVASSVQRRRDKMANV